MRIHGYTALVTQANSLQLLIDEVKKGPSYPNRDSLADELDEIVNYLNEDIDFYVELAMCIMCGVEMFEEDVEPEEILSAWNETSEEDQAGYIEAACRVFAVMSNREDIDDES